MSEYIMNRESLKRHCEATCHRFKDVPTSGTYGEHRLVLDLLKLTEWIPIKFREATEEEKEICRELYGYELEKMYDCPLPEHGEDVLITTCYGDVKIDTFYNDEGSYFENYCDDDEVIAWMRLPKPYERGEGFDES